MPKRPALPIAAAVCALAAASALLAAPPELDGVSPSSGPATDSTSVAVTGTGLEPGARPALLGGGPFEASLIRVPGGAWGVSLDDGLASIAFYDKITKLGGIRLVDVSDPGAPRDLGRFETGDQGIDVEIRDGLAYLAFINPYNFDGGVHVVDLRLDRPVLLGSSFVLKAPGGMDLQGDHVFAVDGMEGVRIIDVSDPSDPVLVATVDTPGFAWDVAVDDGRAYVADGSEGLRIIDVSDPTAPVPLGGWTVAGTFALGVDAADGLIGLADLSAGLRVFGAPDPMDPDLLGTFTTSGGASGVTLGGGLAYLADGFAGLQILDLADPGEPRLLGSQGGGGAGEYAYRVVVEDGVAHVADIFNGLRLIDVTFPTGPQPAAGLDLPGEAVDVALAGSRAATAHGENGVNLADLSDPSAPALLAGVATVAAAEAVALTDTHAYAAVGSSGVQVIDLEGGDGPPVVVDTGGTALDVAVAGSRAYVAAGREGLVILDLADPGLPAVSGRVDTPGSARAVAVDGPRAYVADDFSGLGIVDVSDAAAPVLLGSYDTPGRAVDVDASGAYAYVADLNRGVRIVDVSSPATPDLVASLPTSGPASGIGFIDDRIYIAEGFAGVSFHDVADPAAPFLVGRQDTPGEATRLVLDEALAWVADGPQGLRALRRNPLPRDVASPSAETLTFTVAEGMQPGPYDLRVSNPDGGQDTLQNGFVVCDGSPLAATLEPALATASAGVTLPAPWWLVADDGAGVAVPGLEAGLALPALPVDVQVAWNPAGTTSIEIDIYTAADAARVRLLGPDAQAMQALWETAVERGALALPTADGRRFGPLALDLDARDPGETAAAPVGGLRGPLSITVSPSARYRYDLESGAVTGARGKGAGVDLTFRAVAPGSARCDRSALVGFADTVADLCVSQGGLPGLVVACPDEHRVPSARKRGDVAAEPGETRTLRLRR